MHRHQGIQALPVELLSIVFDSLSIVELVNASHVAHFWRAVAWHHRSFWRNVRLAALSTSALGLFQARLDAGSGRSVLVDISISEASESEFPERLRSVVFPAISRNLYRIDKLYLRIGVCFDVDLFRALHHPAPCLDTLDIVLCHETESSPALPANLFACHAPNLRHVRLLNIQLFASRIPLAFWHITNLRYCFNQTQSFPTALFQHCKQLQSLTIYGRHCTVSRHDEAAVNDWQLKSVELSLFTGGFALMSLIPSATVASITVTLADERSAMVILGHLRGRLEIRIHHTEHHIHLQYTSRDTGMQRSFFCTLKQVHAAYLPPAFVAHDLVSRVDAINCSSICAPLLSAYREMQSCRRLAVSVAEGEPLHPLSRPLSLPALECVEFSSALASRMRHADIASFLRSSILPPARGMRVSFVGIELDVEPSELGEHFVTPMAGGPEKDVALERRTCCPAAAGVEPEPAARTSIQVEAPGSVE